MTRDRAIWSIMAVASASFALGILFLCAIQRSLAHDPTYSRLLFVLIPLCLLCVVINTRRVIKALPQEDMDADVDAGVDAAVAAPVPARPDAAI